MWYVIQTLTGKEEELLRMMDRVLGRHGFLLYRECVWRIEGKLRLHVEPLFPSYVFVETADPERLFLELKRVPRLSRLLGRDGSFWPLYEEEERFLRDMIRAGESMGQANAGGGKAAGTALAYLVRRSLVETDETGTIIRAQGALEKYLDRMVMQRLRKRSVIIEVPFLGTMRRVQLGIRLAGDESEEVPGKDRL